MEFTITPPLSLPACCESGSPALRQQLQQQYNAMLNSMNEASRQPLPTVSSSVFARTQAQQVGLGVAVPLAPPPVVLSSPTTMYFVAGAPATPAVATSSLPGAVSGSPMAAMPALAAGAVPGIPASVQFDEPALGTPWFDPIDLIGGVGGLTAKLIGKFATTQGARAGAGIAFAVAPRVAEQLVNPRLGQLAGRLTPGRLHELLSNPTAQRFLDVKSGHINVIQEVEGVLLRITTPRDACESSQWARFARRA
jgi:hypothetical protein